LSSVGLGLTADEVLTTTRAVRKRLDFERTVDRALLEECVAIATQAPSPRNRQPWDFVIVTDPDLVRRVADWWRRGLLDMPSIIGAAATPRPTRMSFESDQWQRIAESLDVLAQNLDRSPALVVPCVRVGARSELNTVFGQSVVWGAVIPAFWSFMLAARERGLGTCWTTSHLPYEREVADLLGIPFETVVQTALSPVAHVIGTSFRPAARAETSEFIHWDTW
jgi:nitroreductase